MCPWHTVDEPARAEPFSRPPHSRAGSRADPTVPPTALTNGYTILCFCFSKLKKKCIYKVHSDLEVHRSLEDSRESKKTTAIPPCLPCQPVCPSRLLDPHNAVSKPFPPHTALVLEQQARLGGPRPRGKRPFSTLCGQPVLTTAQGGSGASSWNRHWSALP